MNRPKSSSITDGKSRAGARAFFHAMGLHDERSEEHTSELQSHSDLVCRQPQSTLFPYTTLFRSSRGRHAVAVATRVLFKCDCVLKSNLANFHSPETSKHESPQKLKHYGWEVSCRRPRVFPRHGIA